MTHPKNFSLTVFLCFCFSGKIELQGSLEDRLHQLDQRETDLMDEVEKLRAVVRRSRDEKRRAGDE